MKISFVGRKPRFVFESDGIHHQRVAIPVPHRIAHVRRVQIGVVRTPIAGYHARRLLAGVETNAQRAELADANENEP